jgi:aconitate hydratase
MTRGTFGNIHIKNLLLPGVEGGFTRSFLTNQQTTIFDAAETYKQAGIPLMVLAGKEYGTGSSRDWAAKGTLLLGVKAVLAESFERIHRSNLVGMGVLPLEFLPGESVKSLGLTGEEIMTTHGLSDDLEPASMLDIEAQKSDGSTIRFRVNVRIDTPIEVEYYRNGGILHTVLRQMAS